MSAEPGPMLYAQLMDFALAQPRADLRAHIERRMETFIGDFTSEMVEQLRNAYTAGLVDGYRDAVTKGQVPSGEKLDEEEQ